MTDTPETLQSALADLTRRVAAFEKAQKQAADVEPPMLTLEDWIQADSSYRLPGWPLAVKMKDRLRYVEAELARLREGLKSQVRDVTQGWIESWKDDASEAGAAAREIQRHRALVTK